jgi:hypothetical protein
MDYMVYYGSVLIFSRDKLGNYIPYPLRKTIRHLFQFTAYLLITGALQSIMAPHKDMAVFGAPDTRAEWLAVGRLLTWQLYANNAFHAGTFLFDSRSG